MKYIKYFFSCKHPAWYLRKQEITIVPRDEDFEHVVMSFHCDKCDTDGKIAHARCVGGVEALLNRRRQL